MELISLEDLKNSSGDIVLLEMRQPLCIRKKVVPQIPPSLSGGTEWNYNCAVVGKVPYDLSSCEDNIQAVRHDPHLKDSQNLITNEREKVSLIDNCWEDISDALCNHDALVVSYGTSCREWNSGDTQGHNCTTVSGFSGSLVRLFNKDECIEFSDMISKKNKQQDPVYKVPILHGIHTDGTSQGKPLNSFVLSTSAKFVCLYCSALTSEHVVFLQSKSPPFPD